MEDEDGLLLGVTPEHMEAEALRLLRSSCPNDVGTIYRLGELG